MDTINKVYISFMMKSIFLFENWRTLTIFYMKNHIFKKSEILINYFIFEPNIHCVVYPFFDLTRLVFFQSTYKNFVTKRF